MRYAIVSDIHANRQAWDSVLADIAAYGVDTIVCLGDVVGYGPKPQDLLDQVRQWCAAVVIGNHDAAACGRMDASIFNDEARSVVEWTRGRIDDEGHRFLAGLPPAVEDDDVLFVHAEVISPERFDYITDAENAAENMAACSHRMVFVGHTHQQAVFINRDGAVNECAAEDFQVEDGCRYLVNVGSAGEPRDPDDLRGRYAVYDSEAGSVVFRAVEFDMKAYRRDLDAEGLPVVPYFLQARESQEAVAVPQERAMRLMPISEARKLRESKSAQPSRLVVVPLATRPDGSPLTLPDVPATAVNRRRNAASAEGSKPKKSHAAAVWFLVSLAAVAGFIGWRMLKDQSDDAAGEVDLASQLEADPGERVVEDGADDTGGAAVGGAAADGVPVAAAAPPPVVESRPLAAGLQTYLPWDISLKPLAGGLQVAPVKRGQPKLAAGRLGKGLALNAASAVIYGKAGDFSFHADGLTVSFWYQSPKPDGAHRIAIGNMHRDKADEAGWQIAVSHQAVLVVVSDGDDRVRAVLTLPKKKGSDKAWHHCAVVLDFQVGRMRLHLDGAKPVVEYIGEFDLSQATARGLLIGTAEGTPAARQFTGRIDDLAVWHRVMSSAEINTIRSAASGKQPRAIGELLVPSSAAKPKK